MGLSDDQKAMLRLLAQRGEQGYEDVAALKGLSVEEVGAQVREAISTLEEEGIPAPSIPPPPGAPPEDPPAAVAPPAEEKSQPKQGPTPAEQPSEPEPPTEPVAPPKAKPKPAPRRAPATSKPSLKLPAGKGARAAIAAAVGVVVIVVVILLVGGGGDSSTSGSEAATEAGTGSVVAVAIKKASEEGTGKKAATYAALEPVDGGEGLGIAIFGKVKKALALRVVVEGLEQTSDGESYTVWISDGPDKMLPLASTEVTEKGTINAQVEVPLEVLAYLASETFDEIAITRTDEAKLKASLSAATKAKKAPAYTGTEVLRGPVNGPIVGAKQTIEESEAKKKE